jgi:DNA-binding transcriptional LysR family regulator
VEFHQVRYFLAVASTLNFTRAAELCNVTQPALTKAVQKLEHELGGPLIHRERHLTQLTELGKTVLPMLERTLASAEAVRKRAQEYQRREIAPLKIGLLPSISATIVMEPISEIAGFVPGLKVEMREASADRLVEMLLEGEINAALVGDIDNTPERIDGWPLFEERYVMVAAPQHPLSKRASVPIEELCGTPMLERVGCDVMAKFRHSCFPVDEMTLAHSSERENHLQVMAAAGFGVVLSPEHAPRLSSLKAVPIEGDPIRRVVRLLAVAGRRYSPALDAFVKIARLRDWATETSEARRSHLYEKFGLAAAV